MENTPQKIISKEEFFQKMKARDERIKALFMQGKAANDALIQEKARLLSRVNFLQAQLSETAKRNRIFLEVIAHFIDGLNFDDLATNIQNLIKEEIRAQDIKTAKEIKAKHDKTRHTSPGTLLLIGEALLKKQPAVTRQNEPYFKTDYLPRAISDLRVYYGLIIDDETGTGEWSKRYFLPESDSANTQKLQRIVETLRNEIRMREMKDAEREARKARKERK